MRRFLGNLKMTYKVLIAPLIVLIFLVLLSFMSYQGLRSQKEAIDDIYTRRFRGYQNSSKILGVVSNVHANIYRVISWANAKYDSKKIEDLAKEQSAAIEQMIGFTKTVIQSNTLLEEEKKLYQTSLEKLIEYQKPAIGVLDVATTDLNIATMYMGTADDKFQLLNKTLQALLDIENKLAKEQFDGSLQRLNSLLTRFGLFLGLGIVLSIGISIFISRRITSPIERVIKGLTDSSGQVASFSSQVSSASESLAEGASEQAAGLEETSSSLEQMSSMTRQNAENAGQANTLVTDTSRVVDQANQSMTVLNESMKEISKASEETAKIVKTIHEIAFQTNLLALNADVEAARAGEAGAGFAVVADEVRNLAMRAADAARNTSQLIEGTVKKIKHGAEIVSKTNEAFTEVAARAKKVGNLVGEIAAASHEQSQGVDQINKAVSEMDKVVQQNAANAEETAAASKELSAQSEQMREFVDELVGLVGGRRNANGLVSERPEGGDGKLLSIGHSSQAGVRKPMAAPDSKIQGRKTATGKKNAVRPDQVIPMEEGDFKEF